MGPMQGKSAGSWLALSVALLAGAGLVAAYLAATTSPATPRADRAPPAVAHTPEFVELQEQGVVAERSRPDASVIPSATPDTEQNAGTDPAADESLSPLTHITDTDIPLGSDRSLAHAPEQLGAEAHPSDRRDTPPMASQRNAEMEALQAQLLTSIMQLTDADSAARASAVTTLWQVAADLGGPPAALAALETAAQDRDPKVADAAQRALKDLTALQQNDTANSAAAVAIHIDTAVQMQQDSPPDDLALAPADRTASSPAAQQRAGAAHFDQLVSQAIDHPDAEQRLEAITNLALWRDVEPKSIIDTLVLAARDPDAGNRYNAIALLARLAPDHIDRDGSIAAALTEATSDDDAAVAEAAAFALQDLAEPSSAAPDTARH